MLTVGSSRVVEFVEILPNSSVYVMVWPLSVCGGTGGPITLVIVPESCCGELFGGSNFLVFRSK